MKTRKLHIVFDGPPSHEAGRFVEVETPDGKGVNYGEWKHRDDGFWVLEIDAVEPGADDAGTQIAQLAEFIMKEVPGEPSQSQGAVDTAIRIIRRFLAERNAIPEDSDGR